MRRELLLTTLLVLVSGTGCIDFNFMEHEGRSDFAPKVKVLPAEGPERDFLVTIVNDFPRLATAMGNPSDYRELYFSHSLFDAEVFVGAKKDEVMTWNMDTDGSVTHPSITEPIDHTECTDRQPFAIDAATIARLPQILKDAPTYTAYLDNARILNVKIHRYPGQTPFKCGGVEIDVRFDADCGAVFKDKHGAKFYDCPKGDVVYDTKGKLLRSTIDHDFNRYYE